MKYFIRPSLLFILLAVAAQQLSAKRILNMKNYSTVSAGIVRILADAC